VVGVVFGGNIDTDSRETVVWRARECDKVDLRCWFGHGDLAGVADGNFKKGSSVCHDFGPVLILQGTYFGCDKNQAEDEAQCSGHPNDDGDHHPGQGSRWDLGTSVFARRNHMFRSDVHMKINICSAATVHSNKVCTIETTEAEYVIHFKYCG
jgi:hypothetical protein